jgi:hypothetical protein
MSTKRGLGVALALGAAFATCCWDTPPAFAQEVISYEGAVNVQRFGTAPGPRNFLVTRGARSDGEHALSFGLLAHYGNKPLVVNTERRDGNDVTVVEVLAVENLVTADAWFAYTPTPALQLSLRLPVTYVKGQGLAEDGGAGQLADQPVDAVGLSDPELEGKFRFVGDADSPFTMGASLFLTAPMGEATAERQFIGSETVTGGARLIADFKQGALSSAANLGYRVQKEARIGGSAIGSEALFGVGLGLEASPVLSFIADLFGASTFGGGAGTSTLEAGIGARLSPLNSPLAITIGGGPGIIHAIGGPAFRAFVGFSYANESADLDQDGIEDTQDQCPADPEDYDGYEDSDGCPDTDNDGDAIADAVDKCPDEAEDSDGFEDLDGCPDPDNDKDGLPDVSDRCPNEAENLNGFEDEDGCPDIPDTDGDGVDDQHDKCPTEPEDTDGYQDTDGCPDLDNDGDGLPDDVDECVDEAEDMNGFEDEDGCPDGGSDKPPRRSAPAKRAPAKKSSGGDGTRLGSEDNPIEL